MRYLLMSKYIYFIVIHILLEADLYSRKCLPEQLVKDIDTDKAMVVESSNDEWTDESDDDI